MPAIASPLRSVAAWHVAAVVVVAASYRALFVHHGLGWLFDEAWPLYSAMQLQAGASLYGDVVFPFPPGHLLAAWVAYALDPPGVVLARVFYAAFDVALCVAVYLVARRIASPGFALLGALLLAVAAPRSHLAHLLFGYRYLVFSVCALLLLDSRLQLRRDEVRRAAELLFGAGILTGAALAFRLTPAFALACGIAAAIVVARQTPREWVRDALAYGAGLALVALPLLLWFAGTVGLDVLWREVVVRPVWMTAVQSLDAPALALWPPLGDRDALYRWWVAFQFRAWFVLYAGYALWLGAEWLRARRESRPFPHGLLLAIVVFGGIYLVRSLGRSDDHHLMSALPPVVLLVAHGLDALVERALRMREMPLVVRGATTVLVCGLALFAWVHLQRVDLFLQPGLRGTVPVESLGGRVQVTRRDLALSVDRVVEAIEQRTTPEDVVLDVTGSPLLYVLAGRMGPGRFDVVSPGVFLSEDEERSFVATLRERPPALVVGSSQAFDGRADRSLRETAPLLSDFLRDAYAESAGFGRYRLLEPIPEPKTRADPR